eukprot:6146805-Prymnesium_polylepis.1
MNIAQASTCGTACWARLVATLHSPRRFRFFSGVRVGVGVGVGHARTSAAEAMTQRSALPTTSTRPP